MRTAFLSELEAAGLSEHVSCSSRSLSPTIALLPGRTRWLYLCHALPASCADCRCIITRAIAEELEHDLRHALDMPSEAFAELLAPEPCTVDQARELRRLTIAACHPGFSPMSLRPANDQAALEFKDTWIADFDSSPELAGVRNFLQQERAA